MTKLVVKNYRFSLLYYDKVSRKEISLLYYGCPGVTQVLGAPICIKFCCSKDFCVLKLAWQIVYMKVCQSAMME